MKRVHPGTTHLLSCRPPVVTTSPEVQIAEQLVPFCSCDGVAFLGLPNPRQRPAHMFPNAAQRRRPGKAGCSWRPRLSGILSQESGEPGQRSPSMELSADLGKRACRSVGRRDRAAVRGAGSQLRGPHGSLLHKTQFLKTVCSSQLPA